MPLPPAERVKNLELAVRLMTEEIGDEPIYMRYFDAHKDPYTAINSTTWRELDDRSLVTDTGHRTYQLTGRGWLAGIRQLKLITDPQFRDKMSKLSASLKRRVKGRAADDLVDIFTIEREAQVPTGFIYNAIKSHLLEEEFQIKGASFAPDDKNENHLIIPLNYGERHLHDGPR